MKISCAWCFWVLWEKLWFVKPMMFLGSFGSYEDIWYLDIFTWKTKKCCEFFLQVYQEYLFFLEISTTHLTMQCFKCIFNVDNLIDQVVVVKFVETVSSWNSTSKTFENKPLIFVGLLVLITNFLGIKISNVTDTRKYVCAKFSWLSDLYAETGNLMLLSLFSDFLAYPILDALLVCFLLNFLQTNF